MAGTAPEFLPELPASAEAERAVLGCMIKDSECLSFGLEKLRPEYFSQPLHRTVYEEVKSLFDRGMPVDFVTTLNAVTGRLTETAPEELSAYLKNICSIVPTLSNFTAYSAIVVDKYYLRALYLASKDIMGDVTAGGNSAEFVLESAEQRIYDIREGKEVKGLVHVKPVMLSVYDETDRRFKSDKSLRGTPTGFPKLDSLLSGLNKKSLIILAARPGVGKSAFALNIARNVAEYEVKNAAKDPSQAPGAVCVFSLEMPRDQLAQRMLSSETKIELARLATGDLKGPEWPRLSLGVSALSKLPLFFDDTSAITVSEIKARLRRVPNLSLVIIDYLQLLSSSRRVENRVNEVSEWTRALKIMAGELNVPVIVLSQLSRDTEKRKAEERRPLLSDLRESGSIEQDADAVLFLYRSDYYDKCDPAVKGLAECIVAKNRHGGTDTVFLNWQNTYTLFTPSDYKRNADNQA